MKLAFTQQEWQYLTTSIVNQNPCYTWTELWKIITLNLERETIHENCYFIMTILWNLRTALCCCVIIILVRSMIRFKFKQLYRLDAVKSLSFSNR